jgi:hypothetical protein
MVDATQRICSGSARDTNVLLGCRQVAPAHQSLEWDWGDTFVGVVAGGGRP